MKQKTTQMKTSPLFLLTNFGQLINQLNENIYNVKYYQLTVNNSERYRMSKFNVLEYLDEIKDELTKINMGDKRLSEINIQVQNI
jgi:hypothetical protein